MSARDSNGQDDTQSPWPIDRRRYSVRFRRMFPSSREGLNDAVSQALSVAARSGCLGDHQADLEICLREALANAVIHGNAYHQAKQIFLRCYAAPAAGLFIMVRDEGDGFDPDKVPDPRDEDRLALDHGRGLLLMRELMDYVEYRKQGREVVLYMTCSAAGETAESEEP
ncbi:MAG: ATP-binding protein [bacterium]|nr:ATP-binding protein [bacterium]